MTVHPDGRVTILPRSGSDTHLTLLRISAEEHDRILAEPFDLIDYTKADGTRAVHRMNPSSSVSERRGGPACREIPRGLRQNLSEPYRGGPATITCEKCSEEAVRDHNQMLYAADAALMVGQRHERMAMAQAIVDQVVAWRHGQDLLADLIGGWTTPGYRKEDARALLLDAFKAATWAMDADEAAAVTS